DYAKQTLDAGCYVGFDKLGLGPAEKTVMKLEHVAELAHTNYVDRVLLSHDAAAYMDWADLEAVAKHHPQWRHDFLPTAGLESLSNLGLAETQVAQMTRINPANWIYTQA